MKLNFRICQGIQLIFGGPDLAIQQLQRSLPKPKPQKVDGGSLVCQGGFDGFEPV